MTVEVLSTYIRAAGNGGTTVFNFPFKVSAASDLVVRDILDSTGIPTTKTLTTDYNVTISVTDEGGSVAFFTAPLSGHTIDIRRAVALTQPEDIRNQGRFLPEIHEGIADRAEMQIQDTRRLLALAPRLPDSETASIDWDTLLSLTNRKGKYGFFFNATTGLPELFSSIGATSLSQSVITAFLNPQTAAETATGKVPTNQLYLEGVVNRYGNNAAPGTTDMTQAIKDAYTVHKAGGAPVQFLAQTYLVTDTCIKILNADGAVTIIAVTNKTIILNKAGANKPTFQLTGAQHFKIDPPPVFIGATGFPNIGLELIKDGSSNRCAFGYIGPVIACTNGGGVHFQDTNTVDIESIDYWPSGLSYGGTIDVNGQPYALLADGTGAVNGITVKGTINAGGLNSIANGGCALKIDGSASAAPFQAWKVGSLEAEVVGTRALWLRNVNVGELSSLFTENAEIRIDQNCLRLLFTSIEAAATGTVVIDGTQSLGRCSEVTFINCQAASITADATNLRTTHIGCAWTGGTGDADASLGKVRLNCIGAGSVALPDILGRAGVAYNQSATAQVIGAGGTIVTTQSVARVAPVAGVATVRLGVGTTAGQEVTVINESAAVNTVTFDVAATSNVADGASCVIAGLRKMEFTWDSVTSLWYH